MILEFDTPKGPGIVHADKVLAIVTGYTPDSFSLDESQGVKSQIHTDSGRTFYSTQDVSELKSKWKTLLRNY